MKYRIKYNYNTGDSFSTQYDLNSYLELEWENLEIAKENIKRIEEHYKQYREVESYFSKKKPEEVFKDNQNKDWFVKKDRLIAYDNKKHTSYNAIDEYRKQACIDAGMEVGYIIDPSDAQNQIRLYTDDGKEWKFWCPWCGYFESLNYVEIVPDDREMKIYM